jgi:hypothetical protein
MFAFAPIPYVDRGSGPIHMGPLLLLVSSYGDQLEVIADEAHMHFEGLPIGGQLELGRIVFKAPGLAQLENLQKHQIPAHIGQRLEAQCQDMLALYCLLLTQVDEELCDWYHATLSTLIKRGLRAVILWSNLPSLERAAQLLQLPVIHLELGPLRAPFFTSSMYLDFKGVNGKCSASETVKKYTENPAQINFEQDRWAWAQSPEMLMAFDGTEPNYMHGIALQVEDDSNSLAFANGQHATTVIFRAWQAAGRTQRILVRDHPQAHFKLRYFAFTDIDQSANSLEFVSRCESIHTINSSVAFEALLLGRKVFVYGDSPALALSLGQHCQPSGLA